MSEQKNINNATEVLALGLGLTDFDRCGSAAMTQLALNFLNIERSDHAKIIETLNKVDTSWGIDYKKIYMKTT